MNSMTFMKLDFVQNKHSSEKAMNFISKIVATVPRGKKTDIQTDKQTE